MMKRAKLMNDAHCPSLLLCSERSAGFRRQIGEDRTRPEAGIE
jgi:hypothetical protein